MQVDYYFDSHFSHQVNLVQLRCIVVGCKNSRGYGTLEEGTAKRCKEHKQPGDVSRRTLRFQMRQDLNHTVPLMDDVRVIGHGTTD